MTEADDYGILRPRRRRKERMRRIASFVGRRLLEAIAVLFTLFVYDYLFVDELREENARLKAGQTLALRFAIALVKDKPLNEKLEDIDMLMGLFREMAEEAQGKKMSEAEFRAFKEEMWEGALGKGSKD